jgi:uncharacterized protein
VTVRDLEVLARRLPPLGITVIRFEQPWRTAGRRVASPPPRLDVAWRSAVAAVLAAGLPPGPLLVGGRSAGARVACRTAPDLPVAAVVCLAFPLHLPGRPERSRLPELLTPTVPRLVLQGSRDTFGSAAEIRAVLPADQAALVTVVELAGADHGYRVPTGSPVPAAALNDQMTGAVAALVDAVGSG